MASLTVYVKWSPSYGQNVYRTRGPIEAHGFAVALLAEISSDAERMTTVVRRLRSGEPGPLEQAPQWLDGAQEGVQLEHSNGLCKLDHMSFSHHGELVLTSEALADFLDAMAAVLAAPEYRDPASSFPDIEVDILAAGQGAWKTYLERGGSLQYTAYSDDRQAFHHVARKVDGVWSWVLEATGEVVRPIAGADGPSVAPEGDESDLERVVRLLGDVAVESGDVHPAAPDPYGTLVEVVAPFERLGPTDRLELPEFFSDYERRSLVDAVKSLCGRALTEQQTGYLSAAALCIELGAAEHDWRDVMIDLAVVHHTANRLSVEPGEPGNPGDRDHYPRFVERYREFLERTEVGGRGLESFRLIETNQDGRIRFTRFEPPSRNKLGRRREP